jgi:hypothetical protein
MNLPALQPFLSGAVLLGFAALGCFFYEFFRRTRDRLFLFFALAFVLLAMERVVLIFIPAASEISFMVYTVRLCAFGSLAYGIWDRNLRKH